MSKPKIVVGAIVVAVMVLATARISAAGSLQSQRSESPLRGPIHIGGNLAESNLLHRVEPTYPQQAKDAHISGKVVLLVTVDERGNVSDIKVMRGHPLLTDAAVTAVRQWRYAPMIVNGLPVSVVTTVSVTFSLGGSEIWATLGDKCNLRAPGSGLEGEALLQKLSEPDQRLKINASPTLSFRVIQGCLKDLERKGIRDVQVRGFVIRNGSLFQSFAISGSDAPSVILDQEHLAEIVKNALSQTNPRTRKVAPVAYQLFISEGGEVVGVEQQYGPKIPALESELLKVKVTSPGRRGPDSVPSALLIEITGPITM